MRTCRFIQFTDGSKYTTANELGAYLESRGIKIGIMYDRGSHHYGSYINRKLIDGLKHNPTLYNGEHSVSTGYSYLDFPKLLEGLGDNDTIIQVLMRNKLCSPTSVALMKKGTSESALDLYSQNLVECLLRCYNQKVDSSEFVVVASCSESPIFTTNKRNKFKPNSQKPLITTK